MQPLFLLALGMALVVGGILKFRIHAFFALILGAYCVALLTPADELRDYAQARVAKGEMTEKAAAKFPMKPAAVRVGDEFGQTCAKLGVLIAMAAILGEAMMLSGAAESIAAAMLRWMGAARAHWAFFATSFLLCIPVMLDTVMYLCAPLLKAIARQMRRDYLLLILCTVAGGTIAHSLVPPTPGPLFVAGELGVPLGLMIGMGGAIGLGAALSGVAIAQVMNLRQSVEVPAEDAAIVDEATKHPLPPLWLALVPVLLPIALIGLEASYTPTAPWAAWLVRTLGAQDMALTLGAVAALLPLLFRADRDAASKAIASALSSGAVIVLIIGAGGAFGGALRQTGIAETLGHVLDGAHFFALPVVFAITTLVRTAQGSATVAMITSAPIARAFLDSGAAHCHPVYFAIAIGCGSKPFPWMNDGGFWIISRSTGMTEAQTLRTVTPMMALQGLAGLLLTMATAWLWPLQ